MICKYCHTKNPDDAGFCAECGKKLGDAADDCQTMEPSKTYEAVPKAKTKNNGMNPWVVIILLAIGIGSCFCFGGNKFTEEQKEFLHSIGIKNTEIEEKLDNGRYVLEKGYENDHERIVVKVKPGDKGIDEVRYKNCEKLYWNKELGKVGMNKADSEKYIEEFTKKHRIDFDDKNYITSLDKKIGSWDFGAKEMMMCGGYDGKLDNDMLREWASLYAAFHYSDRDWIFFDRIRFNNDNETWVYMLDDRKPDRNIVTGGVHETIYIPVGEITRGLRILTTGENPKMYLLGDNGDCGIEITPEQVESIKEYLQLYYITGI